MNQPPPIPPAAVKQFLTVDPDADIKAGFDELHRLIADLGKLSDLGAARRSQPRVTLAQAQAQAKIFMDAKRKHRLDLVAVEGCKVTGETRVS